jgi:hypothetical protein
MSMAATGRIAALEARVNELEEVLPASSTARRRS